MKPFNSPFESEVPHVFGEMGKNTRLLYLPYPMRLAWNKSTYIDKFSCHNLVHDNLRQIFVDVLAEYGTDGVRELGLDLYGGCLNVRTKRGSELEQSLHSWAIAVDLNPEANRYKWGADKAAFARPEYDAFWKCVERQGAVSLGRVQNFDFMHFQFAKPDL